MDFKKFLTIGIAVGIAANLIDFAVHGNLLADFYSHPPFRQDVNVGWMILSDLVAGFVFAWFYLAVAGSFTPGCRRRDDGLLHGRAGDLPGGDFHAPDVRGLPVLPLLDLDLLRHRLYVCAGAIAGAINKR